MQSSIGIGIQAFRDGRFDEAAAIFDEICQAQPDNGKVAFLLGQAYQALGRATEARRVFSRLQATADPQLAVLAANALASLGDAGLESLQVDEPAIQEVFCPRCGELVPSERQPSPWCVCGWGRRSHARVIYLSHMLAYCRTRRVGVELKLRGDLYVVADDVRIRHLSDQASKSDPRLVFRSERGIPFISREDLDLIIPKVDETALFREKRGQELGVGKLLSWEDLYEQIKQHVGEPSEPPDGSLRALLAEYGGISPDVIRQVEASQGPESLGTALVSSGACSVFELLSGALGATRVFAPKHHQANHLGRLLLEAGAIDEEALKRALVTQVKSGRSLAEILKTQVPLKDMKLALSRLEKLPNEAPEVDRLGEILNAMGALSRTDLAHALQERQKRNRLLGRILVERGMISSEALDLALLRQQLKRAARFEGDARLGQIVVEMGFTTPKQLAMTLVQQIRRPRPLGELLIEAQACTPEQLVTALAEQERRLDALVEERLPEALARAEAAQEVDEEPEKPKLKRVPLADELDDEDGAHAKPITLPSGKVMAVAGLVVVLGVLGVALKGVIFPEQPEPPPMLKALGDPGAKGEAEAGGAGAEELVGGLGEGLEERGAVVSGRSSGKAFSSLNAANTVDVDMDAVVERLEAGDANPLGGDYMGAYQQTLPPSLEKMAANTVGKMDDRPVSSVPGSGSAPSGVKAAGGPAMPPTQGSTGMSAVAKPGAGAPMPSAPMPGATPIPRLAEFVKPVADEDPPEKLALGGHAETTELLMQGERLMAQGKTKQAMAVLQTATIETPDDPEAFRRLGRAQRRAGALGDAELSLLTAARLNPQDARVLADLGSVRMAQGNLDQAIEVLQMAVRQEPKNYVYQNKLGLALKAAQRHEEAAKAFEAAIKADPANPNSHYNLGLMKVHAEPKAARKHFERAIRGFSGLVESRMAYGEALKAQGDAAEALASFQGALKANTLLAEAQMSMGKLQLSEKRFDEAKRHFGDAKLTYRTNAIAHTLMGDAFMALKQSKEASEEWYLASRIAPQYAPPLYQLALLSKSTGKAAEARQFFKRVVDADPDSDLAKQAGKHLVQLEPKKKGAG